MLVLVLSWTQCLPQGVGAPPAMLQGHTAGFPRKLGGRPPERRGRWIQFAQCSPDSPPDCGTPTTSRLYPFGARLTHTTTPHYNKHIHQMSARCLTHCTTGHRGQLNTHYHQTTYPSSPQSTYDMTTDYNKNNRPSPTTRKPTGHNSYNTSQLQTCIYLLETAHLRTTK